MKKRIISILAIVIFGIIFFLTNYSRGDIKSALWMLMLLTIIALLITICATVFFKGSFKQRLLKSLPFSFLLTGIVFLFTYFLQTFLILWV
jgi:Na+/H+-translocating membrane pyrophosphatase